nr:hypothetical protein [Nocardia sp. BMG51109]
MYPTWSSFRWGIQRQSEDHLRELFAMAVCESGRVRHNIFRS